MGMTPEERFTAAAVIIRDALEDLDTKRALEQSERDQQKGES